MTRLHVPTSVCDEMLEHARAELPNECCGLLIGSDRTIRRSWRARNLSTNPDRYLIDPGDHFAAVRYAREADLDVIGAYHSHPHSPPVPSPTDLAEAVGPEYLYVIVSPGLVDGAPVRAYLLSQGSFQVIEIVPDR